MTIIGVDLGLKGGWVALEDGDVVLWDDGTLTPWEVAGWGKGVGNIRVHVFVELPLKNRKGTAISALTSMHRQYGYFQGQMDANRLPYRKVEYHEWARVMLNGGKYPASMRCRELWPDNPEIAAHEGLADAALIAEYGRLLLEKAGDLK